MLGLRRAKTYANYSCNYFRTKPIYAITAVHQRTEGRTDEQTCRHTTSTPTSRFALRASRGKNRYKIFVSRIGGKITKSHLLN